MDAGTPATTEGEPGEIVGIEADRCHQAMDSRDARFDGTFFAAITTTGIYCRPSCPTPVRPRRHNTRFFVSAAAAQGHGFRACKRCRPDAAPGSADWDRRGDLVGRALRLIADGEIDRTGVAAVAASLGVSKRHLHRTLSSEVGAGPLALARAQRATTARLLIETTDIPLAEVAFASGFSSVRQFNETVKDVFASTPTALRRRAAAAGRSRPSSVPPARASGTLATAAGPCAAGTLDDAERLGGAEPPEGFPSAASSWTRVHLRLPYREPLETAPLFSWLAGHAIAGMSVGSTTHHCTLLRVPAGVARAHLSVPDQTGHLDLRLDLSDLADLGAAVRRCRRLADLDADPTPIAERLCATPHVSELAAASPGVRLPGAAEPLMSAVAIICTQQVSVAAGTATAARILEATGEAGVPPTAARLAETDLIDCGVTGRSAKAISTMAGAVADGALDLGPGADRAATRSALLAIPGVGPWTADMILMRCLGDPDLAPAGDLALRRWSDAGSGADVDVLLEPASPWRSYAAQLIWSAHATRRRPTTLRHPASSIRPPTPETR